MADEWLKINQLMDEYQPEGRPPLSGKHLSMSGSSDMKGTNSEPGVAGGMSRERGESIRSRPSTEAKPSVLVFYDYACVFCYTDRFRFDRLAKEYGAVVTPIPFELRPEMPLDGISATEHGIGHGERVERYLLGLAERDGYPLLILDHVPHTHGAMVMAEVARDAGPDVHARVHAAIFGAYFGRGEDIGDPEVLLDVAEREGLDTSEVARAWHEGTYERRIEEFHEFAHSLGVTATPSALVCDELLIGTHPYGQLAEAAERCLARRRV